MNKRNIQLEKVIREESMPVAMFRHTKDNFREDDSTKLTSILMKRFSEHWHKEIEINYILDGKCDYYIDEKHYEANSGDIVIINSESIHRVIPYNIKANSDTVAFTLLINQEFMKDIVSDFENCVFRIENVKDLTKIKICMNKMLNLYMNEETEYKNIAISGLIYELFYELCINGAKESKIDILDSGIKDTKRIKAILTYIRDNYKEPLMQKDVAKKFYLSREYFSRYFKRYTDTTFKEYIIGYRLEKAMELIIESEDSMTNIAIDTDTGFADLRQFIKYFKKYYGITPYQYKLKVNKSKI